MSAATFTSTMTDAVRRPDPARTVSGHVIGGCNVCGAGIALPSDRSVTVICPGVGCGTRVELRMVTGILSDEACDVSCMYARRDDCECSCAGWNHGSGHLARPVPTWVPVAGEPIPVEYADGSATATARRARSVAKVAARAERDAARRAEREQQQAAERAARVAALMENPDVAALMSDRYAGSDFSFIRDMRAKVSDGEELSPRMLAAIGRCVARDRARDERDAARAAEQARAVAEGRTVKPGRQVIRGTIRGEVKTVEYGPRWATRYRHTVTIVDDGGLRYWGTLPEALAPVDDRSDAYVGWHKRTDGQRVTLVGTVEPFADDPTAGKFTHPTVPAGAARLSYVGAADQAADDTEAPAPTVREPRARRPRPAEPTPPPPLSPEAEAAGNAAVARLEAHAALCATVRTQQGLTAGWVTVGDPDRGACPEYQGAHGRALIGMNPDHGGSTPVRYDVTVYAHDGRTLLHRETYADVLVGLAMGRYAADTAPAARTAPPAAPAARTARTAPPADGGFVSGWAALDL